MSFLLCSFIICLDVSLVFSSLEDAICLEDLHPTAINSNRTIKVLLINFIYFFWFLENFEKHVQNFVRDTIPLKKIAYNKVGISFPEME